MPICPNAGKQVQNKPQATSREKCLTREPTPSPRQKCLVREPAPSPRRKTPREAKSKHLVNFSSRWFLPLESPFLSPMPHGLLAR